MFCGASCAAKSPVLLGCDGVRSTYIRVCSRTRARRASCARPCGRFPPQPAMLGTANGAICSSNSSIPGLRYGALLILDPLSRRGQGGSVRQEGAHDARPFANIHGCMSSEPRPALADSHSFIVRARHRGRRLFGYFFFAVEEKVTRAAKLSGSSCLKVTRSPQASGSSCFVTRAQASVRATSPPCAAAIHRQPNPRRSARSRPTPARAIPR